MKKLVIAAITVLGLLGCNLPKAGTGITIPSQATVAVAETIELLVSTSGYLDPDDTVILAEEEDRKIIKATYNDNTEKLVIIGIKAGTASLVLKNNRYTSNRLIVTVQ